MKKIGLLVSIILIMVIAASDPVTVLDNNIDYLMEQLRESSKGSLYKVN